MIQAPEDTPVPAVPTATPTFTPTATCVVQANAIVECADDAGNCAHWEITGQSLANTDNWTLYGRVFHETYTGYFVELYRDAVRTARVAIGHSENSATAALPLEAYAGSGLAGQVDLNYAADGEFTLFVPEVTPSPTSTGTPTATRTQTPTATPTGPCLLQDNGIRECGDTQDSVSNWRVYGADLTNTDAYRLYVEVIYFGGNAYAVVLYKDQARTQLVASGVSLVGHTPHLYLTELLSSGLSGSVALHYAGDNYDIVLTLPPEDPPLPLSAVNPATWRRLE